MWSQVRWFGGIGADFPRVGKHLCASAADVQETDTCTAAAGRLSSWTERRRVQGIIHSFVTLIVAGFHLLYIKYFLIHDGLELIKMSLIRSISVSLRPF